MCLQKCVVQMWNNQVNNNILLIIIGLLIAKHFIVDFLLQTPYMYENKHIFGHPGGILHAWSHGLASYLILGYIFGSVNPVVLMLVLVETIIHYFIDYCKMNIGMLYNWQPNNSPYFWYLLGFDQFLHYMTYLLMLTFFI